MKGMEKNCMRVCPYCSSEVISYTEEYIDSDVLTRRAICEDCGKEFDELYSIDYVTTMYIED